MRVQHCPPLLHLADALVALQILLDVGRTRGIVELVPIYLSGIVIQLLALFPATTTLPLLAGGVEVVIVLGGGPVGELAPRLGGGDCRRRARVAIARRYVGSFRGWGVCYGRLGERGLWLVWLLDLGTADGLEAESCGARG